MKKTVAKVKRQIVKINEEKCDGCGACVISCAEGALKIIGGKAKLVSETYCDGLGACLPGCPQGAITIEEHEAEAFDEEAVKLNLSGKAATREEASHGCPSAAIRQFELKGALPCDTVTKFEKTSKIKPPTSPINHPSALGHWPVQIRLVPPKAPFLQNADVLLAADCTAFSYGGFHNDFLAGHSLLVACPKLDNYEEHLAKLTEILRQSDVKSLSVLRMEVPCCSGLTRMAMQAILSSNKAIPFKETIIGARGNVIS
jgi:Fe-S-cluster-containing hydrogenase component 2